MITNIITLAELLAMADEEVRDAVEALAKRAHNRGDGVAVYRNQALDSSQLGHRRFLTYGSSAAQIETVDAPTQMPSIGSMAQCWAYQLEARCCRESPRPRLAFAENSRLLAMARRHVERFSKRIDDDTEHRATQGMAHPMIRRRECERYLALWQRIVRKAESSQREELMPDESQEIEEAMASGELDVSPNGGAR